MRSWETQGGQKHLHTGEAARWGMLSLDLEVSPQLRFGLCARQGTSYSAVWRNAKLQQPDLSCTVAAHL